MLAHPGMIGRTLKGDIEGDLNAEVARAIHQFAKIIERTELRMDRFVSAFLRADSPRTSRLVGRGIRLAILPFAKSCSNRMNRRKVEDVEAHFCNRRQSRFAI